MYCGFLESKVIDSRLSADGSTIRRRRECLNCGKRFTTYEVVEHTPILVIKNDGTREPFDANKIKNGIIKSCKKRPVAMSDIDALVADIEKKAYNTLDQEIPSTTIGEMVMEGLKNLDQVAYIRFASVYRQFRDVTTFMQFIEQFEERLKNEK